MRAAIVEVADVVHLELLARHHPGRRGLRLVGLPLFLGLLGFEFLGLGILHHQKNRLAIGRPLEGCHLLCGVRALNRFAAFAKQGPELGLSLIAR